MNFKDCATRFNRMIDEDQFFLRSSHFMEGKTEAWQYENIVYVSPALFQLLTDESDMNTIYEIANQFILRRVSLLELMDLVNSKGNMRALRREHHKIVRFQIFKDFYPAEQSRKI